MNLEFLRPWIKYLPEVSLPKKHVAFKEKLIWTSVILILFFVMGVIYPVGVSQVDLSAGYQQMTMIFASNMGSIISVGIGPIVTASIILQLLIGAKIIDLDLSKTENKALFQGAQKIFTVIIAIFEAAAVTIGFRLGHQMLGANWAPTHPIVVAAMLQIALGSILLMFMDEIVSKWGIGSGIGLFIVGGVSQRIISGAFNFLAWIDPSRFMGALGIVPNFAQQVMLGNFDLMLIFPVIATIVVFLVVVFGESMRLEIPLSYGGIRGVGGRYPLKFFYVSVIPVILASALLMNVAMFSRFVGVDIYNPPAEMNFLQEIVYNIGRYVTLGNLGNVIPDSLGDILIGQMPRILDPTILFHLVVYLGIFVGLCVLFGKFWVETTGLGAESVAEQIQQGGMQIPGFRRDQRVIERVLNRYIPQVTILSSVAIGLLAVGADLLGALGSGTGILLTVGILYRLYEEIEREQMSEMHPAFRKFMGRF